MEETHEDEEQAAQDDDEKFDLDSNNAVDLLGIFDKPQSNPADGQGLYGEFESSDNAKQSGGNIWSYYSLR